MLVFVHQRSLAKPTVLAYIAPIRFGAIMTQENTFARAIEDLLRDAEGAYSPRTLKGYSADLKVFIIGVHCKSAIGCQLAANIGELCRCSC